MKSYVRDVKESKAVIIDVRRDDEYKARHASGAVHIPLDQIKVGAVPGFARSTEIYIYCGSGNRAGEAKTILEGEGFINVTNIGGLSDWVRAGGSTQ